MPSVPSVENPSYDLDGNLLTNGVFSYTWDAENRLTAAYSNSVCVVSNAYDHAGRRVVKWTPSHTTTFVYDGWLPILEIVATASEVATNAYVWGKDLSGTLQGAGGVGGLLAVSLNSAWYFPFYDANGNITAYVNGQGVVVAEYVYDAFGGTISKSGTMADDFRNRFSTKYYDAETRLYYYGYRFYNPAMHRWLNRDPIEEDGGFNLYAFVENNSVNYIDRLGLYTHQHCCTPEQLEKLKAAEAKAKEKVSQAILFMDNNDSSQISLLEKVQGNRKYKALLEKYSRKNGGVGSSFFIDWDIWYHELHGMLEKMEEELSSPRYGVHVRKTIPRGVKIL